MESTAVGCYREFVPCAALRAHVYAFFSFVPGRPRVSPRRPVLREIVFGDANFCSPQLADGHVSVLFELGHRCGRDARWTTDSSGLRGTVTGPMTSVGRITGSDRPDMAGIYFRPGSVARFFGVVTSELTDKTVAIGDVWGSMGERLAGELAAMDEADRVDRLESILLEQLVTLRPTCSVDVERLAATVWSRRGRVTVEAMASAAGVSRQHLTRQFREHVGIGPKLYARLARFHAGLVYSGSGTTVDWARAAVDLGYADQSHLISEFHQFSGLTPRALASRPWFHPFIERVRPRFLA